MAYYFVLYLGDAYLDLSRVMEALKKADSFLDMTLTEKCKVRMFYM